MMRNYYLPGFALALALAACTNHTVVEDDDGGGSGSGSAEPQPEPTLDATGTYRLHSTFDLATNMPGSSGAFVNGLIEATDDPDDPMSWLVDQMLAQMQDGSLKTFLQGAKPFVVGYLNDRLTQLAPELVGTIVELGQRMADLTRKFGLAEKLVISHVDQVHVARITADGVRFDVDGSSIDLAFVDHDIDDVVADGVLVTLENQSHLAIGEHTLALPYGKIVRLGLDVAIIPAIDPSATSLVDLLDNVVNCQSVGASIANALGLGSAAFWSSACLAGLGGAADVVYEQIAASDSKLDLHLQGRSRASDSNADYKLDKLQFGTWMGTMTYTGTDATLAQPATFVGARM